MCADAGGNTKKGGGGSGGVTTRTHPRGEKRGGGSRGGARNVGTERGGRNSAGGRTEKEKEKEVSGSTPTSTSTSTSTSGCETAWIKGTDNSCLNTLAGANRWGWTNKVDQGATERMEIWAAAGQCDTSKGTLVGYADVSYVNDRVKVTVSGLTAPWAMTVSQLWAGEDYLPLRNNRYVAAPGSFPDKQVDTADYDVHHTTAYVYVALHLDVCTSGTPPTPTAGNTDSPAVTPPTPPTPTVGNTDSPVVTSPTPPTPTAGNTDSPAVTPPTPPTPTAGTTDSPAVTSPTPPTPTGGNTDSPAVTPPTPPTPTGGETTEPCVDGGEPVEVEVVSPEGTVDSFGAGEPVVEGMHPHGEPSTTLANFPPAFVQANMEAFFPVDIAGVIGADNVLRVACPFNCEEKPCEVFVTTYHCPPCSTPTNGGLVSLLPGAGWEAGSCAPTFQQGAGAGEGEGAEGAGGVEHPTVAFRKLVSAGSVEELPALTAPLTNVAVFVRQGATACGGFADETACNTAMPECAWEAGVSEGEGAAGMCVSSWCPADFTPPASATSCATTCAGAVTPGGEGGETGTGGFGPF